MYTGFYHFTLDPFRLTPDARLVYANRQMQAALSGMHAALEQGDGVLVVTGRSGTGKTTLVAHFLRDLDITITTATLASTQVNDRDILQLIAREIGAPLPAAPCDKAALLGAIEDDLRSRERTLLVVDEAQHLSDVALEELRMLANLHDAERPLLQLFLVGQPELLDRLCSPAMEQLHQRITRTCQLTPLDLEDTFGLVMYRLCSAGWQGSPALNAGLFPLLHRFSRGLPRNICKLCSRLLLHGAQQQRDYLALEDAIDVLTALREERLLPLDSASGSFDPEPAPDLASLSAGHSKPHLERLRLSDQERAFLESHPPVIDASPAQALPRPAPALRAAEPIAAAAEPLAKPREAATATAPAPQGHPQHKEDAPGVGRLPSRRVASAQPARLRNSVLASWQWGISRCSRISIGAGAAWLALAVVATSLATISLRAGERPAPITAVARLHPLPPSGIATQTLSVPARGPERKTSAPGELLPQAPPATPSRSAPSSQPTMPALAFVTITRHARIVPASLPAPRGPSLATRIDRLLEQGDIALREDRLRIPADNSAWYFYQQVLTLAPGHTAGQHGLERITARYAELAEAAFRGQQHLQSREFLERGLAINPANLRLQIVQRQLDTRMAEMGVAVRDAAERSMLESGTLLAMAQAGVTGVEHEQASGFAQSLRKWFSVR